MIEAHGVKGMKATAWRKMFASTEALNAWVEKRDAEVFAVRDLDIFEAAAFKILGAK
jgi:hypothetical protein